jgi:hypothetical protein
VGTLVRVFVFLGLVIYGGWAVFMALQQYIQVTDLVNETVERELPRVTGTTWQPVDRASRLRESIVKSAGESGLPIEANGITVTETGDSVAVHVTSPYTIAHYEDKALSIPISATRSFTMPGH